MNLNLSTPLPTCPCMVPDPIHITKLYTSGLSMFNNVQQFHWCQILAMCQIRERESQRWAMNVSILSTRLDIQMKTFFSLVARSDLENCVAFVKPFNSFHYTFRLGSNLKNVHRHWCTRLGANWRVVMGIGYLFCKLFHPDPPGVFDFLVITIDFQGMQTEQKQGKRKTVLDVTVCPSSQPYLAEKIMIKRL